MSTKKILGVIGAIAVLGGATLAFQFAEAQSQNLIARRLAGHWRVEPGLTARLNPAPGAMIPRDLVFVDQPELRNVLLESYPRYQNFHIYMTGTAIVNGETHMFAVMNENENAHLVLFTPDRGEPAVEPHHMHVGVLSSRTPDKDLLFIGGDLVRESAAVYERLPR